MDVFIEQRNVDQALNAIEMELVPDRHQEPQEDEPDRIFIKY